MRTIVLMLALGSLAAATPRAAAAQQAPNPDLIARGAQIYGNNCARCHNLRSPAEYDDIDWRTITAQMRARANLTRDQARAVLAFVQATNGVPATSTAAAAAAAAPPAAAANEGKGTATSGRPLTAAEQQRLAAYLVALSARPR